MYRTLSTLSPALAIHNPVFLMNESYCSRAPLCLQAKKCECVHHVCLLINSHCSHKCMNYQHMRHVIRAYPVFPFRLHANQAVVGVDCTPCGRRTQSKAQAGAAVHSCCAVAGSRPHNKGILQQRAGGGGGAVVDSVPQNQGRTSTVQWADRVAGRGITTTIAMPVRRSSFNVAEEAEAKHADHILSIARLSTGSMSFWACAYTLACSQIGSTLVSVSVFVGDLGMVLGSVAALVVGLLAWVSLYFLGEVWLHARRALLVAAEQVSVAEHGLGGSSDLLNNNRNSNGNGNGNRNNNNNNSNSNSNDTSNSSRNNPHNIGHGVPPAEASHLSLPTQAALHNDAEAKASGRLMYGDLVKYTLGIRFGGGHKGGHRLVAWAQTFTVAMQVVSLAGTAVSEVIQTGVNMYVLTGYRSPRFWAGATGVILMTPLTWLPSFESLSWLSLLAIVAVMYTAITIVSECALHGIDIHAPLPDTTLMSSFLGLSDLVFIWGSLAMVPEVQSSMKNPTRIAGAFGVDLVYTVCVLIPTALMGLWAFQGGVSSNILQQLPDNVGTRLAALLLSVHMIIAFAVLLNPVMEAAERGCGLRASVSDDHHRRGGRGTDSPTPVRRKHGSRLRRVALRTGVSLFCVLLALAFPFFSDVVGVISAISQTYLTFLAPPYMWLVLYQDQYWRGARRTRRGSQESLLAVVDATTVDHRAASSHPASASLRRPVWGRVLVVAAWSLIVVFLGLGLGLGTWASTYGLIHSVDKFGLFSANK